MRGRGYDQIKQDRMDLVGNILTIGQVRSSHNTIGRELEVEEPTWET
jgi:hypothetical protein